MINNVKEREREREREKRKKNVHAYKRFIEVMVIRFLLRYFVLFIYFILL